MMASNLSKPEIVSNTLDCKIKNLKPNFKEYLTEVLLGHPDVTSVAACKEVVHRSFIPRTLLTKKSVQYWTDRGWTPDEAYVNAKSNKQKGCKSVYSRSYWTNKVNPVTGVNYTEEEADFERNSRRPIRKEYWTKKGYSTAEAETLATETKQRNNNTGGAASAITKVRKVTSKRCPEYFIARGYSEEESAALVSQGQKYFSKEICIEKHGEEKGIAIWQERQDRWQASLDQKSDEEKARINRLKISKGSTVSAAEKIIIDQLSKTFAVDSQFTLFESNKKQYVYDIVYNKKIIEYHGDFWHSNPNKYSADHINPRTKIKASDKWKNDSAKIEFAQRQGYEVLVVWESDFKQHPEKTVNKCIQFLTQ